MGSTPMTWRDGPDDISSVISSQDCVRSKDLDPLARCICSPKSAGGHRPVEPLRNPLRFHVPEKVSCQFAPALDWHVPSPLTVPPPTQPSDRTPWIWMGSR